MRQTHTEKESSKPKQVIEKIKWHSTPITVQVSDTDYGGGVYHGRYYNLYHQARDRFWEDIGASTFHLMQQGMDLTVAELHTFFVKSVYYGDRLDIRTRVLWFREKSMGIFQEIWGTDPLTRETTLRNRTEMNLVCTTRGSARPLPREVIAALKTYYDLGM